ncbi:hypothetical protein ACHAW6_014814 [Cyclotella cf. meneghiniana]
MLKKRPRNIRRLPAVAAAVAECYFAAATPASTASTLYWADMNDGNPSCTLEDPPPHLNSDKLFASKELCCQQMLPWLPAEQCIGSDLERTPLATAPPVFTAASAASTEIDIDCSDPSITRVQCLQAPNCKRGTRQASNGLLVSYCAFKDDSSVTDAPSPSRVSIRTKRPSASPSSSSSASPSLSPVTITNAPTYSPTHSPVDITLGPTPTPTTASTVPPSLPPLENDEPQLFCAFEFSDLEITCSTTAQRCGSDPCPPGMFCFPYDCMVVQSSLLNDERDEPIAVSSRENPSRSPSHSPIPPSPSPLSVTLSESPSKLSSTSSISPSAPPSASPTVPYSTSDFIVELVEWSNIGITETLTSDRPQVDYLNTGRSFSPTLPPTIPPSVRPTSYPTVQPTTSQPTEQELPIVELILPSIADTTLSNASPYDIFGKLEAIAIGSSNSGNDRFDSLIKFDLSLVDRSCTIVSATLKLFSMNSCSGGSSVYVTEDSAWDEDTATWNNAPAAQGIRVATLQSMSSKLWQNLDVTSAVNAWKNEYHTDDSLSIRIMSSENSLCMFAASESGEQTQARLVVEYTMDNGSSQIQQMAGSLDFYGYPTSDSQGQTPQNTLDVYDHSTSSSQAPTLGEAKDEYLSEIVLIATADASVSNMRQSDNFGTQNELVVDGGDHGTGLIRGANGDNEQFDALLKFDTSSISPLDVESALFRIHVTSSCSYGGDIYVTNGYADWNQETVTWDNAPQPSGLPIGSLSILEAGHWYTVDLSKVPDIFSSDQVTLRIVSPENSRCMYTSRDRGNETAPLLVLKLNSTAEQMEDITPYDNISTPLKPTQELIPVSGNFILIVATDDATIDATSVDANLGSSSSLSVDYNERAHTIHDIVIRFDMSQMNGGVLPRSALLTLFTEGPCRNAGTFMTTEGDGEWNENNITWASAPNYVSNTSLVGGNMVGTFGEVASGRWYGFSVTEALTEAVLARKKAVTFRLTSGGMQSCSYSSLQSGRPPKLLVAF